MRSLLPTMILGLLAALIMACGSSEEDLGDRLYELRSERTERELRAIRGE